MIKRYAFPWQEIKGGRKEKKILHLLNVYIVGVGLWLSSLVSEKRESGIRKHRSLLGSAGCRWQKLLKLGSTSSHTHPAIEKDIKSKPGKLSVLALSLPLHLCTSQSCAWDRPDDEQSQIEKQIILNLHKGILNHYTRQRIRGTETSRVILEYGSHKEIPS